MLNRVPYDPAGPVKVGSIQTSGDKLRETWRGLSTGKPGRPPTPYTPVDMFCSLSTTKAL